MCYVGVEVMNMRLKSAALCLSSAALLLAISLHPACAVYVEGRRQPGLWSYEALRSAERMARAASEEVARGESALPPLNSRTVLTLLPPQGEARGLALTLLDGSAGVDAAWRVLFEGEELGKVTDDSAMLETVESVMATRAAPDAACIALEGELRLSPVYIPVGTASEPALLMQALRERSRVVSVFSDGTFTVSGGDNYTG